MLSKDEFDAALAQAGRDNLYFEDWLNACKDLLTPFLDQGASAEQILRLAFDNSISLSHHPLLQAKLKGFALADELADEEWFQQAVKFTLNNQLDQAAKLYVDHGINSAICCGGYQPGCEMQKAIVTYKSTFN